MTSNPVLSSAAEQDRAGNHDEAVNILARATMNGDLEAMTVLGKRLVVGDRAPYLPKDGAGMVLDAARKGEPEAIAQVAVFQCTGVFQPQDWQTACVTLSQAARLGWTPAREQLLLLTGCQTEDLPDRIKTAGDDFWLTAGRSVDFTFWRGKATGEKLSESPLIEHFPEFIPAPICDFLMRRSADRLQPALVYDPMNKRNIRFRTRTNSIAQFTLVENELIHFLLQERMSAACGQPVQHMEATAILNYKPGEQITNHYDFVDPELPNYAAEISENGQRVITFLIYLNDDYTGGETAFPDLGIDHKGRCGEGLYFVNALPDGSADIRTLHAGKPPVTGEKWIVSQFIRNRPVKYILDT